MAERSKALRSGRSPLLWAWVRIPLLTNQYFFILDSVPIVAEVLGAIPRWDAVVSQHSH